VFVKLLIVEDEPGLQFGLNDLFEEAGHEVTITGSGKEALEKALSESFALVILDLGLPDIDGTLVLEQLNKKLPNLPVLVLTSRANESDIILGFKMGAYDYVTKPFSTRILRARAEALVQRVPQNSEAAPSGDRLTLGEVVVDFDRYEALINGEPLHLTTREIEILKLLYRFQGKPVSRHDILDEVWGMQSDAGPRTVDTHVALLRKKIEARPDKPQFLISQRGIGYKLVVE
jgi:DNA-binding response OmpR family regulator